MKRQIWGIVTGCCMSLIASCSQETEDLKEYGQDPLAIRIEARVGESSGVLPRMNEDGTAWTENDYIHVREASTGKTVEYRYTTSGWVPAVSGNYLRWEGGSLPGAKTTFDAWYPQDATGHNDFTLPNVENKIANQSTSALLAEADWMVAHQVTEPGDGKTPLTLTFERRMAKVSVTVLANSEFFDGGTIQNFKIHSVHSKVEGNAGDNSEISVYPLAVSASGKVQTDKNPSLSFGKDSGPTYTAIIFPTEKTEKQFITLKVVSRDGFTSQELTLTDTPELKPGYFYKFKLKTGKTRLEIESVSVENWEDGTLIGGNEGEAMKWDYIGSINGFGEDKYENVYFWDDNDLYTIVGQLNCRFIYMPYIPVIMSEWSAANYNNYTEKITALKCTEIVDNSFLGWSKLKEVNFPEVLNLGTFTFRGCSALTIINIPLVTTLGTSTFWECTSLKNIELPQVTELGENAFRACSNLIRVIVPKTKKVGRSVFMNCSELTHLNLPVVESIGNNAFQGCEKLDTLILGTSHEKNINVTMPTDSNAKQMTSNCTLILGVGTSGNGAASDKVSTDFSQSTDDDIYKGSYLWAGLPWKEIIIKNATGEIVKTYSEKNNN